MPTAVVVGYGYAGRKHAEALQRLGYTVIPVDSRRVDGLPPDALPELLESSSVELVVFACTPRAREEYLQSLRKQLEEKLVVLEKPPVRPASWRMLASLGLDWVPVHNYLYMPTVRKAMAEGTVEAIVLRPGPHRGWYTSVDDAGGGILLDHGYHWLYVASELDGISLETAWIDTFPETEAAFATRRVRFYGSWRSPFRATILNHKPFEPRSSEMLASLERFYVSVLRGEEERARLRSQALEALSTIELVYEKSGLPWRGREGRSDEPNT